jgi:Na+-translocating ferredoxin:NAD+ oxidoreductase RnfE subunit
MYEQCIFQTEMKGTYFEHSSLLQMNTSPGLLQMAQYIWNITHNHYRSIHNQESSFNLVALFKELISVSILEFHLRPFYIGFVVVRVAMGKLLHCVLQFSPNCYQSVCIPHLFTLYQCYIISRTDRIVKKHAILFSCLSKLFMLTASIFSESVMLVFDSCYYVWEQVGGRDICIIHSQR